MTQLRPDMFEEAAVRLDGVSLRYDSSEEILSGIDLVLKPGSFSFLTGASGAGKSSLVRALLEQDKQIQLSISFTTRSPRPQELNGREYHFISEAEFKQRQVRDEFLEYAQVHGNYYG